MRLQLSLLGRLQLENTQLQHLAVANLNEKVKAEWNNDGHYQEQSMERQENKG